MPTYRMTFQMTTGGEGLTTKELKSLHADMQTYLRTVLLPNGGAIKERAKVEVESAIESIPYYVHIHDTSDCQYCREQADS